MNLAASYLSNLVQSGYRSNAFAPLVWFNGVSSLPLLYMSAKLEPPISYFPMAFMGLMMLFTMCVYLVLLIKNPKLLQSERYRLEDKKLDIIQSKGGNFLFNPDDLSTPPLTASNDKKTVNG